MINDLKIIAKTCYLGTTGYAAHARNFFRALSRQDGIDLRIINYTWDENYDLYLNEIDKELLWKIVLRDTNGPKLFDFHTHEFFKKHNWKNSGLDFNPEIEIILIDNEHYFFREDSPYPGILYRIAYTVWESTELSQDFIEILKCKFDQVWVVTEWHKQCLIKQGVSESKIFIVREAVNSEIVPMNFYEKEFHPIEYFRDEYFNFIFFGRWDYRKCLPEIINAFLEEFKPDEKVRMIISAENHFAGDNKTAIDRIKEYGFDDDRIVSIGFVNRLKYLRYLQSGHCFVSCARSEGWNIPLIEAMAAGTPSIYSNWGAQLEFAEGKGLPVKIKGESSAALGYEKKLGPNFPGNYADPDFEDLKNVMRYAKDNYEIVKTNSLVESEYIRNTFTWENSAISGKTALLQIKTDRDSIEDNTVIDFVTTNFVDGPYVEIHGKGKKRFKVLFNDRKTNHTVYETTLAPGEWARSNRKWWTNWHILIMDDSEIIWEHIFDVKNKRVFISLESSSLGDNLAWFPHSEIFRIEKEAHVIVSTFYNEIFKDQYPEIEFINKGEIAPDLYAAFRIGWFYKEDSDIFNSNMHPANFRSIPMQNTATDILGLPFSYKKPKITIPEDSHPFDNKKYVTIAIHASSQAKYWNNSSGWQDVVDFLRDEGYRIVLISSEENGYMGNNHPKNIFHKPGKISIHDRINEIKHSDFFIGIGSGLSWLAWATDVPVILISGFSDTYSEFEDDNVIRLINKDVCNSCFNRYRLNAGDWNWCPDHKGTPRQFECTKMIGSYQVIKAIKKIQSLNEIKKGI